MGEIWVVDTNNPTGYSQVVEELQNGSVTRQYTYGLALISQRTLNAQLSTLNFFGMDGHGNVRFLTDASGAKTDTYDYDAFGVLIASTGNTPNNYLYCGEQWDADLGMYFLRARYLNPGTGRFWTMDGFEGNEEEPGSLHKYLFANGNPIENSDPSGHYSIVEISIIPNILGPLTSFGQQLSRMTANWFAPLPAAEHVAVHTAYRELPRALLALTRRCQQNVIDRLTQRLSFNIETFIAFLENGGRFYNGLTSQAPLADIIVSRQAFHAGRHPLPPAQPIFFGDTITQEFQNHPGQLNALTADMYGTAALLTFFRPVAIDSSHSGNNPRTLSLLFHEALHGYGGFIRNGNYDDDSIKNAFGITTSGTIGITDHIKQNCF